MATFRHRSLSRRSRLSRSLLLAGLVGVAAGLPRPAAGQEEGRIPGLLGLDDVVIGVNDLAGAKAAYERLGFTVVPLGGGPGEPGALIDLGNGYVELATGSADSVGAPGRYTFEGGLAQVWEVEGLDSTTAYLKDRGARMSNPSVGAFRVPAATSAAPGAPGEPDARRNAPPGAGGREAAPGTAGAAAWRIAAPLVQPVSGTSLYFVDYDEANLRPLYRAILERAGIADPTSHPNGARRLAYVTVAVRQLDRSVDILKSWGLHPLPPVADQRGSRTVEIPLPKGRLYLTTPTSGGGINDFLEERRAMAPPEGDRFYEGSILAVGIGVEDLEETTRYMDERDVAFVSMDLPSGRTAVVQGAPGWNLRLEFVEVVDGEAGGAPWGAHGDER